MDTIFSGLYIDDERLYDFAASCAKLLPVTGRGSGASCASALRQSYLDIRRCHGAIERRYGDMASPPAACEWLLDNWYMVRREYLCSYEELRKASYIRRCREGALIEALCRSLVESGHGKVTEARCRAFLDGFQSVTILNRSELSLFPVALRCAVLRCIALICRRMQYAADTDPHAKALAALFSTLRLFSVLDAEKLLNASDVSSAILSADPTGDYTRMDAGTRHEYLRRLERLARRRGLEEHELAKQLIKQAKRDGRHVGFYLYDRPPAIRSALYIAVNILLTLFLSLLTAFAFESIWAAVLLLLPVSELVKSLMDYILLHLVKPRPLPRMDMRDGVPAEGRSVCVISCILGGSEASLLEKLRLACRSEGSNVCFGLLADLPAAKTENADYDEALLSAARREVERLNRKYGGGFYLFTRGRSFDGEQYSGRERKRGAVLELAKLLCDEPSELIVTGDKDALKSVRYIISLDSDTQVYPGAVGELIGAALHPLCTPVIDPRQGRVISGHAILHPRIETELQSANATDFVLIFAGVGGSDPYGGLCGELYMDAFQNGSFSGKGLIDARALLRCTAHRLPEGRVLSHDALEGAYLRGGYMGDAAFSDRFPTKPLAYYKRLHRWTRGDWQNAPWIFHGELTDMDRFRLFDSLRRSLIAPATLIAIVSGFFLRQRGLQVASWAALLALLTSLVITLAESSMARRERVRLRRHTRLLTGVGGAIVQTFARLWLLPYESFVCLTAVFTALWRMLISRRRLLQWQTAAQSEKGGQGLAEHIKAMWFPVVLGMLLMAFSPAIIGKAAGFMWLLSPAAAAALALPAYKEAQLGDAGRAYLVKAAAGSWRYLAEFSGAEDSFLPPDNFQEQPPVGVAHRSSPTNIGLAMAAAVAASDMGIIGPEQARAYIARAADALDKMPRLMGHFFNWYDTRTLKPMKPAYISTVDSGNLYAGLLCAAEAAAEWGDGALAARLRQLMEPMDFSPLYDWGRGLFYICYDVSNSRGAGGWYDLLASEAMLTSYLAIAKGDVPKKHWRRLSRAQLQKDGFRGLASWTGTMFEYLMPELFLPVYRSSLLYESGRFCVYAQKRRAFAGKPWGISESAFYSLDSALSYRYKAHGCPALALKRGQEADMVISPYSTFLALCIDPEGAVRNLRRLESFGAVGRYGYMEALDFTPGRCRSDSGEQVRCYMAHHAAMSVIAAANAVCSRSIQRRFMGDPAMAAHSLFLQEKLPVDAPVIRRDVSEVPEKPRRDLSQRWRLCGGAEDKELRSSLLSNGAYNIMLTNSGRSTASLGGLCVYYGTPERGGMELRCDGTAIMPADAPSLWELSEEHCRYSSRAGDLTCSAAVAVAAGDCGELRIVELRSPKRCAAELTLSFRPILADYLDYVNHPAYWQLGLEAELEEGKLLLHRLPRGEMRGFWLCLCASHPAEYSADREGGLGALSSPLARMKLSLRLDAGRTETVCFALCVSPERSEAVAGAERMLLDRGVSTGSMVGAAAAHLGMSTEDVAAAMDMTLPLWRQPLRQAAARSSLWQYGVSGSLPIICCDGRASESDRLLKRFCLLKSCGMNAELIYLSDEHGEYLQPLLRRISLALAAVGLESLIGSAGGVFLVPQEAADQIKSRASLIVGEKPKEPLPIPRPALGSGRTPGLVPIHHWEPQGFEFYVNQSLPARCWQHMLTNGSFGYLATDSGMGCMWMANAREMRIDPPPEDVRDTAGAERIYLETGERQLSVFAANDGVPCRVRYGPGFAVWEKELDGRLIRSTAFIPSGIDARVLLIEGAQGLRLRWGMELTLGAEDGASVLCRDCDGLLIAENPDSSFQLPPFLMSCSSPPMLRSNFVPAAAELTVICEEETVLVCGCCSKQELFELCKPSFSRQLLLDAGNRWRSLTGRFTMSSAAPALDHYMSFWGVYQCVAGRLLGRSSLYQSGGAIGFRDQLQDSVNLLLISPAYARDQILDCCRHQYIEGDVMHWWHRHPEGDRGVRTRCSDDMLWLCWALCEYCDCTGDSELCGREESYVNSPLLLDSERDRYETPERSLASASCLDHAKAALECCISRGFGPHGLPLIGSGDWNDALDDVRGESVWLGWFFAECADRMAALLTRLGKPDAGRYREYAEKAGAAADESWNGEWYLRGYYADGEALGDGERIDSVCQSWAAMSRFSSLEKADSALSGALSRLVDRERRLVKLFDPPYSASERSPGYITGYGAGFRENGGQYTHGAIWLARAAFERGRADEGWELLSYLLPESRDLTRYEAEPFVLPADVYSAPGHEGEAGWTWYTGSAGWFFRVVTESMLGLRLCGGKLTIRPRLPSALAGYSARWKDGSGVLHSIECSAGSVTVDGEPYLGGEIG